MVFDKSLENRTGGLGWSEQSPWGMEHTQTSPGSIYQSIIDCNL